MGRQFESKSGRKGSATGQPGAARILPLRLMARVPVIGRLARPAAPPPPARRLSPRRVLQLLRRRPSKPPPPPGLAIPFVSPMIRGVRRPIERTAAVVKAARDVRRPRTRWERLREAARLAIQDPISATKWERLMGLGVGLVAGKQNATVPAGRRLASPRVSKAKRVDPVAAPRRSLRERLRELQSVLNDRAGPRGRNRRDD
jgi:hypothetical protein